MSRDDLASIERELHRQYPLPPPPAPVSSRWRLVVRRVLWSTQGALVGLILALGVGIAGYWVSTPIPLMVSGALTNLWVVHVPNGLAHRAYAARVVALNLAALPFWWWP